MFFARRFFAPRYFGWLYSENTVVIHGRLPASRYAVSGIRRPLTTNYPRRERTRSGVRRG